MKAILAGLFGFGCALAVVLGGRMGGDRDVSGLAVALAVCGPVVLVVLLLLHRANDAMTQRALSGVVRQNTPETAMTHFQTLSGAGRRYGADLPVRTHSSGPVIDAEWRSYGYEVPTKTRRYRRHPLGTASANVPIVETMTPARAPDVRSDFLTPMFQSLFSGFVAMLAGAVISWRLDGDIIMWAIVGFVAGLAVAWLWRLGVVDSLLQTIERVTQTDIDGDGVIGDDDAGHLLALQPDQARQTVAQATRQTAADDRLLWLISFVARCYAVGTSESAQGIKPGERAKYLEARDLLFRLGLAEWRSETNKRLGWDMTTNQAMTVKTLREHVTAV